MELTWLAMGASLMMALGAACLFIFAVKKDWMRDLEDTKYQVFWSDVEELVEQVKEKQTDGRSDEEGDEERG